MAEQPQVGSAGLNYKGLHTAGMLPPELRKNGVDDATKLRYLTRDISKFSSMISTNFKAASRVKDRIFVTREIMELERFYTVRGSSGPNGPSVANGATAADPNHQWFALGNAEGSQVQELDLLFLPIYAEPIRTPLMAGQVIAGGGANVGPDLNYSTGDRVDGIAFSRTRGFDNGVAFYDLEQVQVTFVGEPNSAGPGLTAVRVERCYFGPSATDQGGRIIPRQTVYGNNGIAGADPADVQIQFGDRIFRGSPSFFEGTNAPKGIFKNPVSDTNFTQEFKYAVELTNESELIKTWISDSPMDINRWITTRRMNRDTEISYLLGKKGRISDTQGREQYLMGGVFEFILKDNDHILSYPYNSLSWPGMLELGKPIFGLGGGETRYVFTGITLDIRLKQMFYNSGYMRFSKEESNKFGYEVNELIVSGGVLKIVPSQIMEEFGYGNMGLCLDMSNKDAFEPVTNEGWDMKVDKGPNGKGIQEPGAQIYKEQIIGMFGLRRRDQIRHSILDFSNAVVI